MHKGEEVSKTSKLLEGTFVVIRQFVPVVYEIKRRDKTSVIHDDRLKPCHDACFD